MKITCGTDIIDIDRIKQSIEDLGDKFLKRVYTDREIEYCEGKNMQRYQHYAARFAAKEAAFKALSQYLNDSYSIEWKDIEVENSKSGRPKLKINKISMQNIESMDISISHCKKYAVATVTVLTK